MSALPAHSFLANSCIDASTKSCQVLSILAPSLTWMALYAVLFLSVGLHGRFLGAVPLHFAAVSSAGALVFIHLGNGNISPALAAVAAVACISLLNTLALLLIRSTAWLRTSEFGQIIALVAFGSILTQALVQLGGYNFYAPPSAATGLSTAGIYRSVGLWALLISGVTLLLDLRPVRIQLIALAHDRVRAALAGVNVVSAEALIAGASSLALSSFAIGATYMRGHQIGIDSTSVIMACGTALVWRFSRIWHFALAGILFAVIRLGSGLILGARWQDTVAFLIVFLFLCFANRWRPERIQQVRADGIHNPLGNDG